MIRQAVAIHDAIDEALSPMPGGYYRVEDANGNALVPSWWLHVDASSPLNALQDATIVILDVWAEDRQDLDDALVKVDFLRDHDVLEVGSYRRQSIAVQAEAPAVLHATILVICKHFAGAAPQGG